MLFSILGAITGLGPIIGSVTNNIIDLQKQKEASKNNIEKAKIDASVSELEARRAVLVAEAGNRLASAINASVRLVAASGAIAVVLKLMLWDKVVGAFMGCAGREGGINPACSTFRTDPLDANQWAVITAVIAFYFMYDIAARFRK